MALGCRAAGQRTTTAWQRRARPGRRRARPLRTCLSPFITHLEKHCRKRAPPPEQTWRLVRQGMNRTYLNTTPFLAAHAPDGNWRHKFNSFSAPTHAPPGAPAPPRQGEKEGLSSHSRTCRHPGGIMADSVTNTEKEERKEEKGRRYDVISGISNMGGGKGRGRHLKPLNVMTVTQRGRGGCCG